jgi:hypothetical protein
MSAAVDGCLVPEVVYACAVEKRLPELDALVFDARGKALIAEIRSRCRSSQQSAPRSRENNNRRPRIKH